MSWIKSVPLLLFVFIAYNLVALSGSGSALNSVVFQTQLLSGVQWTFTSSDLLLALAIVALCGEMIKATSSSNASIVDHALSMLVFVAFLVEFIAYGAAGTSIFFLMTLMSAVDVLAGFTVTIAAARRDVDYH